MITQLLIKVGGMGIGNPCLSRDENFRMSLRMINFVVSVMEDESHFGLESHERRVAVESEEAKRKKSERFGVELEKIKDEFELSDYNPVKRGERQDIGSL